MKKIVALFCAALFFFCLTGLAASAQSTGGDLNLNGISDALENAVESSPEISSLVDQMNQGVEISSDRLLDALKNIEGLDVDQLLQGLNGLDENDGLLGRLASILGPNSNGLSGVLSQLGEQFSGLSGSLDLGGSGAGNALGGLLGGGLSLPSLSGAATTAAPTVHTTASAYTQSAVTPYTPSQVPTYTYTYSSSVSTYTPVAGVPAATANYNQYTVPYVAATTVPATTDAAETTFPAILDAEPTATVPAVTAVVAVPVAEDSSAAAQAKKSSGWKKAVGAVLVLGAFGGIAAVVIKKSM